MYLNSPQGNRAARRLAEAAAKKAHDALAQETHTISVLTKDVDGVQTFRWGSNKGDWYSPEFTDSLACMRYAEDIGLSKQDE